MQSFKAFVFVLAAACLSSFGLYKSMAWQVSDSFAVGFDSNSKHAVGTFGELTGDIQFDPQNLGASSFNMSIPVESIKTGNSLKNKHARGKNWFDAEQFPNITFVSSSIRKTASGYEVDGTLQMHGVSKPVTMPFSFADNTFKGSLTVNRIDFGVGSTKGMSKKVPVEIQVDLAVPVTQ